MKGLTEDPKRSEIVTGLKTSSKLNTATIEIEKIDTIFSFKFNRINQNQLH